MKTDITRSRARFSGTRVVLSALALVGLEFIPDARADETCSSPYLARIEGQEEFVYVWTLAAIHPDNRAIGGSNGDREPQQGWQRPRQLRINAAGFVHSDTSF